MAVKKEKKMLEEARSKEKCLSEEVIEGEREKTWAFQEGQGCQYLPYG